MNDEPHLDEDLGLDLRPGEAHYRAYVGPPEDYDLISAMTFSLLSVLGLRQNHTLLDIGCGSLRVGRLLIPYLNRGKYVGIEPNEWLVNEGVQRELGQDLIHIKQPELYFADNLDVLNDSHLFDFAVAQSIFSHTGIDYLSNWLKSISHHLSPSGALLATFLIGETDSPDSGWVYPDCVYFTENTMTRLAENTGLQFQTLDWSHPRQTWALFTHPEYDKTWFHEQPLTWNTSLAAGVWGPEAQLSPNVPRKSCPDQ